MARMKIRPGGKVASAPIERHPVEVAAEGVLLTDFARPNEETGEMELVPAFSFPTAEGRGTSPEIIPFDELPAYVEVLLAAQAEGVPRRVGGDDDEPYVPTPEILAKELRQGTYRTVQKDASGNTVKGPDGKPVYDEHGERVFLRSRDGRGAKTQKIRPEHFDEFVAFVEGLLDERDGMMDYWNAALPDLLEERRKEEIAAAAAAKSGG